jgi:uncharacterized protein YacL
MEPLLYIILVAVIFTALEVAYIIKNNHLPRIKSRDRAILIDTSVLMDGRIVSIAGTGFMGGTLVVPRSVVGELQLLADQSDSDRRARAREGLNVVAQLQAMPNVTVELLQDGSRARDGVDERLLELAKQHGAAICTIDYNLNKVAAVEGITVLNINELAQAIRMAHLPGERMLIELVQKGQEQHQAVGYLPDGTMVVVEQANSLIGSSVEVQVVRSLQTAAGKMMFAKRVTGDSEPPKPASQQPRVTTKKPTGKRRDDAQQRSSKQDKPTEQPKQPQRNNKQVKKSHGRVDREASLIDLVDNQPD